MGCVNSGQPRHSPLVDREDDPWDADTSIALSGWVHMDSSSDVDIGRST